MELENNPAPLGKVRICLICPWLSGHCSDRSDSKKENKGMNFESALVIHTDLEFNPHSLELDSCVLHALGRILPSKLAQPENKK